MRPCLLASGLGRGRLHIQIEVLDGALRDVCVRIGTGQVAEMLPSVSSKTRLPTLNALLAMSRKELT